MNNEKLEDFISELKDLLGKYDYKIFAEENESFDCNNIDICIYDKNDNVLIKYNEEISKNN